MAVLPSPEASRGILGAIKGALGLFDETNKAQGVTEVSKPTPTDEYESSLNEVELIELVSEWKKTYATYYQDVDKTQQLSFNYWIGNQKADESTQMRDASNTVIDNLIFEATETFLPIATRANPDPLVSSDPSEIGQETAKNIKNALVHWADSQKLRRKLAKMTRHWALYRLGVIKIYWNPTLKEIKCDVINPRRMIFDRDGYIDEGGRFVGEYLGEKKQITASLLVEMFPAKKGLIEQKAHKKMGTKLEIFEWWYRGKDNFYTLEDNLLGKYKNPNWNYDGKEITVDPETGAETVQEFQGTNHFKEPQAPYVFLSVFSAGLHPHDDTSLIMQNITIQDMVNRRWRQIDKNVEGMNNGMVVSGAAFTEEQAAQAASALRRGVAIRVPNGKVGDAVQRFSAPALPNDVFNSLQDGRSELRNIYGTSGSTPEGVQQEKSVRGKIMVSQQDSSRIGGGVTEHIEQVADTIYNWVVQLMYVFYDEEHFITSAGAQGGLELISIKNDKFSLLRTLTVTVKEGSLIPKDPLTQRNEAIDLWSANAIDPLNLFKKLDYPDPVQATQQLILWQMLQKGAIPPQAYLPSFQVGAQTGLPQPQGVGGPAVNPLPEGQSTGVQAPAPQSQEAVGEESKQLLRSVPA